MGQFKGWNMEMIEKLAKKVEENTGFKPVAFSGHNKPLDFSIPEKQSKFKNQKTIIDNLKFDSKKEAERYGHLKLLEKAGEIKKLKLQVPFELNVNMYNVCKYIADFVYYQNGIMVVEDVKSDATRKLPVFRIKKKLMKAIYNIDIKEV